LGVTQRTQLLLLGCYYFPMEWSLLAPLGEEDRKVVLAAARKKSFARKEVVFHEGDPSDSVYLVVSGHLAVQVSTPEGERATLDVLGPGGWFGELTLLKEQGEQTRSATVLALEAATTLVLAQSSFHQLCDRYPRIERLVATLMAVRIRQLDAQLLRARYVALDRRVYSCLLEMASKFDAANPQPVIPLTQDHLADMVGGARPTVNQVLKRLADERVISVGRGKVRILDLAALRRKVDQL
jgi:CRP/FNR family cyclic AMP-dependent transcriptional regulator